MTPDPEDNAPQKREHVFEVLDELIAHMNTTRHIFVLLIASAFILAPICLIMAAIVLSPPPFVQGGVVDINAIPKGNFTTFVQPPGIVTSSGNMNSGYYIGVMSHGMPVPANITGKEMGTQSFAYKGDARFITVGGPPGLQHLVDFTTIIIVFIVVSVSLASIWLFIGLKEYRFFARWNKKFSRYMSLKERVDKELTGDI
ncbi:MAG: hypothetical protein HY222_03160 [Thaumarchaeota archaeon]|nr:hypothetical protein [Nitrososphaerota archaeon]MBI3641374.1 hypothetical protein [Nitrososphaerota archaeon]